ncbi:MGMT family protein [Shewanella submarina]|uniref:MGMT family protein n=1 Tax=Shewanella submarina TaxID=2016376 RepID=A0ABV7GL24_9GAMM|nr:MGMT family protein [Shewanella submarina]MCL1038180.1 MGMT family protein [Shewanella submarina]
MENQQNLSPKARIWQVVGMIPQGQVCSYGKVADLAGLPGRARYVSRALKEAPQQLTLPWHRVVNSQGKVSLPKDSEPYREQMSRLRTEGVVVNQGKIDLSKYGWQPDLMTLLMALPF